MKKIILTTCLVAVAGAASAHMGSPNHNMHHVKQGLNPHANGVIALSNGGYKSWKERRKACLNIRGEYKSSTGECVIEKKDKFHEIYYSTERIPTDIVGL